MTTGSRTPETLNPPAGIQAVAHEDAVHLVELDQEVKTRLNNRIDDYVTTVMTHELGSEEFRDRVTDLHSMGADEIREAADISNRMLEQPLRTVNGGVLDDNSDVSMALLNLRRQVEELDPSTKGDLLSPRRLLGIIPLGNRLKQYFRQYQSAQSQINAVIDTLYRARDELHRDNASIEEEKANAWAIMHRLEEFIYVAQGLDAVLAERVLEVEGGGRDTEKARIIRDELLFYARQKVEDFLTQLAVTIQGYLTLEMVRRNNLELIKGIDRATTTTVSALRTAVMAAQALTNQKLVLDQITALNSTTSNMIQATSAMLKSNAGDIHRQATGSTIELDKLKQAFNNVYDTMDMVSAYKGEALGAMQQTIAALTDEVTRAKQRLALASADQPTMPPAVAEVPV